MIQIHRNVATFYLVALAVLTTVAHAQQTVQQPASIAPAGLTKMAPGEGEEAATPVSWTPYSRAAAGRARGSCHSCQAVCCPRRTKEKVKKHCWNVLCENVCVPAFQWPWERCCKPKCGRVRGIHVLEKHEYECTKCGYEWSVRRVCSSGNGGCARGGACCPDCGAAGASCDQ